MRREEERKKKKKKKTLTTKERGKGEGGEVHLFGVSVGKGGRVEGEEVRLRRAVYHSLLGPSNHFFLILYLLNFK